jgi:hypothetical protein
VTANSSGRTATGGGAEGAGDGGGANEAVASASTSGEPSFTQYRAGGG